MSATLEQLKSAAANLPETERAELAEYLLQSLSPDQMAIREEWHNEVRERLAEYENGRDPGLPMEQVLGRLRELYP